MSTRAARPAAGSYWVAKHASSYKCWHRGCYSGRYMEFKHQPDSAERPPQHNKFKAILVVDDDRQLVQALQWILADQNFLVDKAYDGQEALLKVRVNEYDAIICDMMMPRLLGDEFYSQSVEIRPQLGDRFIFITGFAADRDVRVFLGQNNLKYFVKPFRIKNLIECVQQVLAGTAPATPKTPTPTKTKSTKRF